MTPHLLQPGQHSVPRESQVLQDATLSHHGEQQMLDADVFVLQGLHVSFCLRKKRHRSLGQMNGSRRGSRAADLRHLFKSAFGFGFGRGNGDTGVFQDGTCRPVSLIQQGDQHVFNVNPLMMAAHSNGRG